MEDEITRMRREWDEAMGGYAFPNRLDDGMWLRDYFAGQALAAIAGSTRVGDYHYYDEEATRAYKYADAMIAARKDVPSDG